MPQLLLLLKLLPLKTPIGLHRAPLAVLLPHLAARPLLLCALAPSPSSSPSSRRFFCFFSSLCFFCFFCCSFFLQLLRAKLPSACVLSSASAISTATLPFAIATLVSPLANAADAAATSFCLNAPTVSVTRSVWDSGRRRYRTVERLQSCLSLMEMV